MRITDREEIAAENAAWRAFLASRSAHHATDAFSAGWFAGRDYERGQQQLVADHGASERERRLRNVMTEAIAELTESGDALGVAGWLHRALADGGAPVGAVPEAIRREVGKPFRVERPDATPEADEPAED